VASLDAWALVDTLNRLRVLITRLPGLRSKSPGAQVIVRALKPVEDLRNAVQHMDGEIGPLSATNLPLWVPSRGCNEAQMTTCFAPAHSWLASGRTQRPPCA
jgi:hypothetical protein